jgi:parvulin-like peptidyl-prolyl isomerase
MAFCTVALVGPSLAQIPHLSAAETPAITAVPSSNAIGPSESAPLAPGDPVLFIRGVCRASKGESLNSDNCTVAVSRQEFEELMKIVSPRGQMAPAVMNRFAKSYGELLAFDSAARESGIDKSPQYQETMRWLEAQTLADLLRRRLEKESGSVSEAEAEAYYRGQLPQFEEVRLQRLVLPKNNFAATDRQRFEQDAQRIAAELRERAVHGEDLERLQKEGYEALSFSGLPPATEVGNRRRANLPPEVGEDIFSLRPGEVSKVENETNSLVIYKVEAKRTLLKEQVRDEINREVSKQKLERALKSITGEIRTELNEKYFRTAAAQ